MPANRAATQAALDRLLIMRNQELTGLDPSSNMARAISQKYDNEINTLLAQHYKTWNGL